MTRLAAVAPGDSITSSIENADRAGINKTMQLMTPTSVSTGSIGTYGAVTFSGASAISVNGCFTSEFDWYDVVFDITTSGSATMAMTLRLSGTDATTAYDRMSSRAVTTTTIAQALNQSSWGLITTAVTGYHMGRVHLFAPALAAATRAIFEAGTTANPQTSSDGAIYAGTILHRTATAYDGFTITPSTGTITGSVRVYGII